MYEVRASRYKHHQHTLMKNTMLIPLVTVTWFLFGWWIYWAFPTGPGFAPSIMNESAALITDESTFSAKWYVPTSDIMISLVGTYHLALKVDSSVISAALSFIIEGANPGPVGNAQ